MNPARTSERYLDRTRLLVLQNSSVTHSQFGQLHEYLQNGDVLVVNRSATLPSAFQGLVRDQPLELRLAAFQGPDPHRLENWYAVVFGAGDWRMPTENRGFPTELKAGDSIQLGEDLMAEVIEVPQERLLKIHLSSRDLLQALYKYGRPIQYSYLQHELNIWDQQPIFSGPPISVEPPSAGFSITWEMLLRLRSQGVRVTPVLHGAGLSSSGSLYIDKLLPLSEYFEVPHSTAVMISQAHAEGRAVVALGTTVLRALESSLREGEVRASSGLTSLKITPDYKIRTVTGLITGMHEIESSHMQILSSLCRAETLALGYQEALSLGYRGHEYGDLTLIIGQSK